MERELLVTCSICRRLHAPVDALEFEPVCAGCAGAHPFAELAMSGSFPLSHGAIDDVVTQRSPGNFALGYLDGPTFLVFYVGRSDSDVRARLHAWVGAPSRCGHASPAHSGTAIARWIGGHGAVASLACPSTGTASAYTRFAFSYAASADAAFAKQCRNYDDFGGSRQLDNAGYPASPARLVFDSPPTPLVRRTRIARSFPRPRPHNPAS